MLHFQGQMTCERIVAVLTAAGLSISKRQVVRLLTAKLDLFRAEEETVFTAGLRASGYVSVDDTGARHAGKACYTTQFGRALKQLGVEHIGAYSPHSPSKDGRSSERPMPEAVRSGRSQPSTTGWSRSSGSPA